jgi:tRNA-dihydrouridine synthase
MNVYENYEKPLLLAPMAELSHRALRELIDGFGGCDEYFTEMISAGALLSGGQYEAWYIDNNPAPEKLAYQLVGGNIDHIAQAAAFLDGRDCAGIDINMGCAAPPIVRAGGGVAWMASIEKASELIARTRQCVKRRLSVKLRLGFEDNFEYLVSFCKMLEAEGVERVTLHPRAAKEKFRNRARWEYVGELRERLRIPVAGNGDILSVSEIIQRSGEADAVMIGRLAVKKPWIFAQARNISLPDRIDLEETAFRFLDLLEKYQPRDFHTSRARRFFTYFCDNLKWANYVKTLLGRETELEAMRKILAAFFHENPEERFVQGKIC